MSDTLTHDDERTAAVTALNPALRRWTYATPGSVETGSDEHRKMFRRLLPDTHDPYHPAVVEWPKLAPDALPRVTALPVRDMAVQTQGRASVRVKTCAATVEDPLLREAIEQDDAEEARHRLVLPKLVGIPLAQTPPYPPPKKPGWSWMITGYSECIDSFLAFGPFRSARQSGCFPPELVDRRRTRAARAVRVVPERKRRAHERLRSASFASHVRASARALRTALHEKMNHRALASRAGRMTA